MVLDVSIEEIDQPEVIRVYPANVPDLFTVHVDSKRILTVLTDDDGVASKWLSELLRSKSTNTKPPLPGASTTFPPDSIFVGLVAEEHLPLYGPRPYDSTDHCLDLLTLCVGSHCLMLELDGGHYDPHWDAEPPFEDSPKLVKAFFQNPRVVVLGTDMAKVAKRLEARHGIKIKNAVDLNQLSNRYYYRRYSGERRLSSQKIMFTTVDAYLRLLMCFKLLEAMDGPGESSSSKMKKKKKNSKKKITKRSQ
ncbi:hypothetical protein ACLB2K_032106 [Fragaria x ananassa]